VPSRILLIEDNPGEARLVQVALAEGAPGEFAVTTAERLAEALALIRTERFEAVVCDLGLPDSTGLATAQAIFAEAPWMTVVVLTGSHDDDLGREAIRRGAQDYLVKGEAGAVLIARTLRYAIERKRLETALREANTTLEYRVAERTADLQAAIGRLTASEARFRVLIEQSLAGIYIAQENEFRYANPRLEQLLGYGAGKMVGVRLDGIVIAEDLPILRAQDEKLRVGASSITFELRARKRDGSIVELGAQGARAEFDGKPAIIGMAQDISEKKRVEEQGQRYVMQLEAVLMNSVQVATTICEMRDPYTAGHQRRVAELGVAIGAELGWDADRLDGLRVAAYLHDVGKVKIPADILLKPRRLTRTEFNIVKGHAQAGYEILKDVAFHWPVAQSVLQHHERMDGSGYPQGLKGDAILFEARILAVADAVEAMVSHRPYRATLGIVAALEEIGTGRGVLYDADVVDACVRLFQEKGFAFGGDGHTSGVRS